MLTKEHFKQEILRMKNAGDLADDTRLIMPQFMIGTNSDNHHIKREWLERWWQMLNANKVDDEELTALANWIIAKARCKPKIINYFPTDREMRQELELMRSARIMEPKKRTALLQRATHKKLVHCVDCGKCHAADYCCWYAEAG